MAADSGAAAVWPPYRTPEIATACNHPQFRGIVAGRRPCCGHETPLGTWQEWT